VRRDLKLLLGSNLVEVINAAFPVIACRKPANTILVPNRFVRLLTTGAATFPRKTIITSCCMIHLWQNKYPEVMFLNSHFTLGTCGLV
jgi:hypothetical protein